MSDLVKELTDSLQKQINAYQPQVETRDVGTVLEAGDGIARAEGLGAVQAQELVQFANGVMGIAFNLEQNRSASLSWATTAASSKVCRCTARAALLRCRSVMP